MRMEASFAMQTQGGVLHPHPRMCVTRSAAHSSQRETECVPHKTQNKKQKRKYDECKKTAHSLSTLSPETRKANKRHPLHAPPIAHVICLSVPQHSLAFSQSVSTRSRNQNKGLLICSAVTEDKPNGGILRISNTRGKHTLIEERGKLPYTIRRRGAKQKDNPIRKRTPTQTKKEYASC